MLRSRFRSHRLASVLLYVVTAYAALSASSANAQLAAPAEQRAVSYDKIKTDPAAAKAEGAAAAGRSPRVPASSASAGTGQVDIRKSNAPALIPLKTLLGPSRFRNPQLSPDGRFLAFVQPSPETGVNSIFVTALPPSSGTSASTGNSSDGGSSSSGSSSTRAQGGSSSTSFSNDIETSMMARGLLNPVQVTRTQSPVSDYFWTKDGSAILLAIDSGSGTEDFHLYWVPLKIDKGSASRRDSSGKQQGERSAVPKVTPGDAVNLTPFPGVRVQGVWLSSAEPDRVLAGLNQRQKSVFDIYSIDLKTHTLALHAINPGNVTTWVMDPHFDVGAAVMVGPDGSCHLVYRDPETSDGCPASATNAQPAGQATTKQAPAGDVEEQRQRQQSEAQAANSASSNNSRRLLQDSKTADNKAAATTSSGSSDSGSGSDKDDKSDNQQPGATSSSSKGRKDDKRAQGTKSSKGSKSKSSSSSSSTDTRSLDELIQSSSSKARVSCWREMHLWPFGEEGRALAFNKAADGLYITTSVGRDTAELVLISTAADKFGAIQERLASNPLVDVSDVVFTPNDREPDALSLDYHKPVWSFRNKADQQDWDKLEAWRPDEVAVPTSRSRDRQVWVVEFSRGNGNNAFFLHRRGTFPPLLIFRQQPALGNFTLADTHSVVITARDGLKVPGYLTLPALPELPKQLPAGLAGDVPDPQRFTALLRTRTKPQLPVQRLQSKVQQVDWKLPLVLVVHGGPWKRASWGSSTGITQWLANRGYAVLNVNFRASIGFGKTFTHKGDGQWGVGYMQHDLSDAVAWAVKSGIADPQRVCIMGASYGGYATFAGLAFTPQLYQCGVSFSGIANLADFVRAMPPYWGPIRNRWLRRVGNVTADEALNRRMSPAYHAHNIKVPVLIGQGGNDVRVVKAEAETMFNALKKNGNAKARYVLYSDEGHGLARLANRLDFYSRAEHLLADVLGGRKDKRLRPKTTSAKDMS